MKKVTSKMQIIIFLLLFLIIAATAVVSSSCAENKNKDIKSDNTKAPSEHSSYIGTNAENTHTNATNSLYNSAVSENSPTKSKEIEKDNNSIQSNSLNNSSANINLQPYTSEREERTEGDLLDILLSKTEYNKSEFWFNQLIVVQSYNVDAKIYFFEKQNGNWNNIIAETTGWVGKNGANRNKVEGDKTTPIGLFSIGSAFYIDNKPKTGLETFNITQDTYWVDDPTSAYYNKKVDSTVQKDWASAEHMINYYSNYNYGFVINYNMNPIVPNKGAAIFFHCGTGGTAGCVAVSQKDMLYYLSLLNIDKNPHILIL